MTQAGILEVYIPVTDNNRYRESDFISFMVHWSLPLAVAVQFQLVSVF